MNSSPAKSFYTAGRELAAASGTSIAVAGSGLFARIAQEGLTECLSPERFHEVYLDSSPANVSQGTAEALGLWEWRQRSAGDKCSDAIALGDRQQQMGRKFSIVLHGHVRSDPSRQVTDTNRFQSILRQIIIGALDAQCQTLSSLD